MADSQTWPSVLVPSSEDWSLRGGTRSGGQTFQGNEQIVASPTARWTAALTIPCFTPDKIRQMRRVVALGRSQAWLVGPVEISRAPWFVDPETGGGVTYAQGASDAAVDAAYASNDETSSNLDFEFARAIPKNAVHASVFRKRGGLPSAGALFSIAGRMHVITELTSADPINAATGLAKPGFFGINVRPWFRDQYAPGTKLEFGAPQVLMRLATDDTGAMDLQLSRHSTVTLNLVEVF